MTQLEINLDTGLPTLVPYEDSGRTRLSLSTDVVVRNKNSKCDLAKASISEADKSGFFISFYIERPDKKFNVMENLLTRGTESWDGDERFAEYRTHLATAMKLAVANGVAKLPSGYTMADLEKAKGVRWAQKAGCKCGCSPAYSTPLWSVGGRTGRWVEATLHERLDECHADPQGRRVRGDACRSQCRGCCLQRRTPPHQPRGIRTSGSPDASHHQVIL